MGKNERDKAADFFEQAVKAKPDSAEYHFRLGQAYGTGKGRQYLQAAGSGEQDEKTGRKAEAKQSYATSLRLAPGAKDVTEALKRVS
jgi:tetratricopeptide (TPR) repeat protein